jgi:hypothetical protein
MHTTHPQIPEDTVRILVSRRMGIRDLVTLGNLFRALGEMCDPFIFVSFRFIFVLITSALFA